MASGNCKWGIIFQLHWKESKQAEWQQWGQVRFIAIGNSQEIPKDLKELPDNIKQVQKCTMQGGKTALKVLGAVAAAVTQVIAA